MPNVIRLITNWNHKVESDYFIIIKRNKLEIPVGKPTTLKIADNRAEVDVEIVKEIKTRLDKLTDVVTYLDSGLSKQEYIDYWQRAYTEDLSKGFMYIYLIKRLGRELPF